jgi:hypothetical protein
MDLSIINEIAARCPEKVVQRNCKLILKKLSLKSSVDVGHVSELVTVLYILDMFDYAVKACDLLSDAKFDGDYTLWDNVVDARLVKARILRKSGKEDMAYKLVDVIMAHEHPNLWSNQSECLTRYDQDISEAKQRNSARDIMSVQLIKCEMMIRFAELPSFPLDKVKLNEEINNLATEIRGKL